MSETASPRTTDGLSPAGWAPAAWIAGAAWATVGVRDGFTTTKMIALVCGASLSVWLLLIALSELRLQRRTLQTLLPSAAVTVAATAFAASALLQRTHHRPLGAVTLAAVCLVTFGGALWLFQRRTVPVGVGVALCLATLAGLSVPLAPSIGPAWLDPSFGLVVTAALFLLGPRVRPSSPDLSTACTGAVLGSSLIAWWLAPAAAEHPFILGLPGLLR